MSKRFIITFVLFFIVLFGAFAANLTPVIDNSSTYTPTQIVNGDFSTKPWIDCYFTTSPETVYRSYTEGKGIITSHQTNVSKIYHGVDEGWNTTEIETWDGNFFEWSDSPGDHGSFTGKYLDMNVHAAAVLWQDLTTYGCDVIRWTLDHGASNSGSANSIQTMRVEVGAPLRNADNSIIPASGYGRTDQNNLPNSQTVLSTNATYKYNGITNGAGTVGFANDSELTNLTVKKGNSNWYKVKGVYAVPDGQTVTRFAFISEADNPACGNELSNITFSTLIGNLSAKKEKDGSLKIKGYWGDSDNTKKLKIQFNNEDEAITDALLEVSMSDVLNQNFIITIDVLNVPTSATSVDIYHQDYESAKRTVEIVSGYLFYKEMDDAKYSSGTDNPSKYLLKDPTFTLNNPYKPGYEFVGWTEEDNPTLNKAVQIKNGEFGDRTFTANWHKHEWVYTTKGSALIAYCKANNLNSNLCSYHDVEHAVSLFMQAQWNAGLAASIQPSNATNKNVIWTSNKPNILTVDQKGKIHGVSTGDSVTVTATTTDGSNKTATCIVSVTE